MSATPADDAQTSPAWNCGCKDTKLFWIEQIKITLRVIFIWWMGDFSRAEPQELNQMAGGGES